MGRIFQDLSETIGHTPLVRLNRIADGAPVTLLAKLEYFNPGGSVKCRIGVSMIREAERSGLISPGKTTIIEPTSGNTGIALSFVCAARGYRLILTMPETMSVERRMLLRARGAELVLTPARAACPARSRGRASGRRAPPIPSCRCSSRTPPTPRSTARPPAAEIWDDTEGQVDIFVAGVGTGGTITGVGEVLKAAQALLSGWSPWSRPSRRCSRGGRAGPHRIQGIGVPFVPKILNRSLIDEVLVVSADDAMCVARRLGREEGILGGISCGAALHGALQIAHRRENEGKMIVVVLPDTGERYLSTPLYQE